MADELIAFLAAVGALRGFLLVKAVFAAWRATALHRHDDHRSTGPGRSGAHSSSRSVRVQRTVRLSSLVVVAPPTALGDGPVSVD